MDLNREFMMGDREVAGISFVGLLTTLAVLALLLAIAVPSWHGMRQRQYLRSAAVAIESAFRRARSEARRRNRPVYVQVDAGTGGRDWCWLVTDRRDCSCLNDGCRRQRFSGHGQAEFPGIRLQVFPRHGRITFYPLRATTSAGSVRLSSGRDQRRVIVSSSGRIRRCAEGRPRELACR